MTVKAINILLKMLQHIYSVIVFTSSYELSGCGQAATEATLHYASANSTLQFKGAWLLRAGIFIWSYNFTHSYYPFLIDKTCIKKEQGNFLYCLAQIFITIILTDNCERSIVLSCRNDRGKLFVTISCQYHIGMHEMSKHPKVLWCICLGRLIKISKA